MPVNRPQGRKKNVTGPGTGVQKRNETVGGGPVGSQDGYAGRTGSSGGRSADGSRSGGSGGGSPLKLIIILLVLLFGGGGGLGALLGGGSSSSSGNSSYSGSSGNASGTGSVSSYNSYSNNNSGAAHTPSGSIPGHSQISGSGSDALSSLLGMLGQNSNSVSSGSYSGWSTDNNTGELDLTTADSIRPKYTSLKGNGRDRVTIMVYMCGTDLESRSAMATADLSEMNKASISDNVRVIVYTGGCSKWQNNIVSSDYNQIYQVTSKGLKCLVSNDGFSSMTDPENLTRFIQYCSKNFPADRNELIFWDHGGGSITGYGYDEKHARTGSMDLKEIHTALENAGVKFDFIGFDACLMATLENALSLSDFADYMLASEETEPGTGWYYTNWLTELSKNTSIPTTELGRNIIDDFIDVSARQAAGQSTTLSLIDLAELESTLPEEFSNFARDTIKLIEGKEYKAIASARGSSREFARTSKIDQVDVVSLARQLEKTTATNIGSGMIDAVLSAVKYNRTSRDMTDSYGLSIYWPKEKLSSVDTMVETYQGLGLDSDYTDCLRKLATIQASGQTVTGGSYSPFDILPGTNNGASTYAGSYGSLYGGSATSAMTELISSLLFGRSLESIGLNNENSRFLSESGLSEEDIAASLNGNIFDPSQLVWSTGIDQNTLHLKEDQWELVQELEMNIFYDDGEGYIDLGCDNIYNFNNDGDLVVDNERSWISINGQPVAYYFISSSYDEDSYTIIGRVPCLLNGIRCNLILVFDDKNENGYIAGARYDYVNGETDTIAKSMYELNHGDQIDFLCDYYKYDKSFDSTHPLGKTISVDGDLVISNTYIDSKRSYVSYRFTDIFNQQYWTPVLGRL